MASWPFLNDNSIVVFQIIAHLKVNGMEFMSTRKARHILSTGSMTWLDCVKVAKNKKTSFNNSMKRPSIRTCIFGIGPIRIFITILLQWVCKDERHTFYAKLKATLNQTKQLLWCKCNVWTELCQVDRQQKKPPILIYNEQIIDEAIAGSRFIMGGISSNLFSFPFAPRE